MSNSQPNSQPSSNSTAVGIAQPQPQASGPLVFITGASSGIGQALAARYAAAGWRIALVARRVELIEQWARESNLPAGQWRAYAADVQNTDSLLAAAETCRREWGVPDVVIANAGIGIGTDTRDREDIEVMQMTLATNVVGVMATFHVFLEAMRQRRSGTLVGIASVASIRGLPGHGAYCASKSAVVAYCESLRGECRGSGLKVVTLLPGFIATPMTARNRYPMPFLMSAAAFANLAFAAISRGDTYRVIPWQMAWVAKLLRALPNTWYDKLLAGRGRKPRRKELGK